MVAGKDKDYVQQHITITLIALVSFHDLIYQLQRTALIPSVHHGSDCHSSTCT